MAKYLGRNYTLKIDGMYVPAEVATHIYNDQTVMVEAFHDTDPPLSNISYKELLKAKKDKTELMVWLSNAKAQDILFDGMCTIDHIILVAATEEAVYYNVYFSRID